jgi:hypothetical protein
LDAGQQRGDDVQVASDHKKQQCEYAAESVAAVSAEWHCTYIRLLNGGYTGLGLSHGTSVRADYDGR